MGDALAGSVQQRLGSGRSVAGAQGPAGRARNGIGVACAGFPVHQVGPMSRCR